MSSTFERRVTAAVAAGAQVLDEKIPGWYRQIDISSLDMSDGEHCICGQLAGGADDWEPIVTFLSGIAFHDDRIEWANFVREHGFGGTKSEHRAWLDAIQARIDHDALPAVVEERELVVV